MFGLLGTAVNVQTMAFGNMGQDCGTGVAFTRDPSTGQNVFYGEFLINAQGEDVVAGIRTPQPVKDMPKVWQPEGDKGLGKRVHQKLMEIKDTLEAHYKDVQDIEFTIERGEFFMLQTRNGKRTGPAAVKIACDMVKEKLIDEKTAIKRIPANDLTQLLLPSFDPAAKKEASPLTVGLPASPGGGVRQTRLHRRGGGAADEGRRDGAAGPQGDEPRGRRRHAQCRGHPHLDRRDDQPRGGGRSGLG